MRTWIAALALAVLTPAAPAQAQGDPIMPLGELQAGMKCTALSVIRGTEPASFDAEIVDVVDGDASTSGPRILVQVSGAAIDATGVGPGFSGSPIYCPASDGTRKNAGAISESIGEYGGKLVLATPIEQILGVPVDAPAASTSAAGGGSRERRARAARASRDARPLMAPLTISGLSSPLARALTRAAAKHGRALLAAPAAPLAPFPVVTLKPGSAMSAAFATGDITTGAVGTVAYVDGDKIWAYGHALDNAGGRSLVLQDAYVYRVVNNPNQLGELGGTYKLAAGGHNVGTISYDAAAAIAGRTGAAATAPGIPVRVVARDLDTKAEQTLNLIASDETDAGVPVGGSPLAFIAPIAVAQAANSVMRAAPLRVSGELCLRITIRESKTPIRFCNRYVANGSEGAVPGFGNVVAARAASDVSEALTRIDAYNFKPPHVTEVSVRIDQRRGVRQAFMRSVSLPGTVRRGRTYTATVRLLRVRGDKLVKRFRVRIPRTIPRGFRTLTFVGEDSDIPGGELLGEITLTLGDDEDDNAGSPGPTSLKALLRAVRAVRHFDGVRVRAGRGRPLQAFRDPELRLSGKASVDVVVR